MKMGAFVALLIIPIALYGSNSMEVKKSNIYELACNSEKETEKEKSPWHISNLYDCQRNELFIPYQLWSGAKWDGNKNTSCMHEADTAFYVNGTSGTTIKGPKKWVNPKTQNEIDVWFREKMNGSKRQYFTCNKKGIGP